MQSLGTEDALVDLFQLILRYLPLLIPVLIASNKKWNWLGKAVTALSEQGAAAQQTGSNGYALVAVRSHQLNIEALMSDYARLRSEQADVERRMLAAIAGVNSYTDRQIATLKSEMLAELDRRVSPPASTLPQDAHIATLTAPDTGKGEAT